MNIKDDKVPNPKELEKELNDYLTKKYGKRFKLGVNTAIFPQPDLSKSDEQTGAESKSSVSRINFDIKPEELEVTHWNLVTITTMRNSDFTVGRGQLQIFV